MLRHYYILILSLLIGAATVSAEENVVGVTVEFKVAKSNIDSTFRNNAAQLAKIRALAADTMLSVTGATLSGSTSLEDSHAFNSQLAIDRRTALKSYIQSFTGLADDRFSEVDSYIDWADLRNWISQSDYSLKQQVIDIIDQQPELVRYIGTKEADSRIIQLKALDYGRTWQYIIANYFDKLRSATAQITYEPRQFFVPVEEVVEVYTPVVEPIEEIAVADTIAARKRYLHLTLKNNLLYDALLVPNIGIEIYLGKKWSIDAYWMYSWWKCDHQHNYWRTYGGDIAIRRWFGDCTKSNPKTPVGFHVGAYAQMITYDFEIGGRGYLGDRWSYAAGLELGFAFPIARRFNIDFNLGLGYLAGEYKEYLPIDGHYVWQSTKQRNWVGPTKLEVSLVWLIGHFNHNHNKKSRN